MALVKAVPPEIKWDFFGHENMNWRLYVYLPHYRNGIIMVVGILCVITPADNHFNGFHRCLKEFLKNVENCLIYGQKTLHFYTWAQKTANISETVHFETNKVGFSPAGFEILFEMACSGGPQLLRLPRQPFFSTSEILKISKISKFLNT